MSSRSVNSIFGEDYGSTGSIDLKYDESKKSNSYRPEIENNEDLTFNEAQFISSIDRIDELLNHSFNLNNKANEKLIELSDLNENLDVLIHNNFRQVPRQRTHLATPTDQDDLEKSIQLRSNDIPLSPELVHSDMEDIEFEINNKVTRMIQTNYNDDNIINLKNTVNSTFDLLKFEENGTQLMTMNDEIRLKSEKMVDQLTKLVETFT